MYRKGDFQCLAYDVNIFGQQSFLVEPSQRVHFRELCEKDPISLYRHIRNLGRNSFLFETGGGRNQEPLFSFIGFDPEVIVRVENETLYVNENRSDQDLFSFLRDSTQNTAAHHLSGYPYLGGWVGYIGYDFISELYPVAHRPHPEFPAVCLGLYRDGVVVDRRKKRAFYFTSGQDRFEIVQQRTLEKNEPLEPSFQLCTLQTQMSKSEFIKKVELLKDAIYEGEIYQSVLSRRLHGRYSGDLFEVYERLRLLNRSPHQYYLQMNDVKILGCSPEQLVSSRDKCIMTVPIAGTRPIGKSAQEERHYREELLSDEKELAEHNMLVDLARNDLGRIAQFGSVQISSYLDVEPFSHVQHLVSRVQAELSPDSDVFDAFASLFPAGTVSGAPKIRAMQLLQELELLPRGPYAGAVGYFSTLNTMDFAITIRSIVSKGKHLYLQAGAGIVADSDPEREWVETENKLVALLAALHQCGGIP